MNGFQTSCASCGQTPPASDAFVAEVAESVSAAPSVYFSVGSVPFTGAGVGLQFAGVLNGGEAPFDYLSNKCDGTKFRGFHAAAAETALHSEEHHTGPNDAMFVRSGVYAINQRFRIGIGVSVTDNAPGSPQVLELRGSPSGPPSAFNFTNVLRFWQPAREHQQRRGDHRVFQYGRPAFNPFGI